MGLAPPRMSGMWGTASAWCRATRPCCLTSSSHRHRYKSAAKGANIGRCASRLSIERGQAMPFSTRYIFVVSMDVDPAKEALFNEVYDTEHVPNLLKVPGVHSAARMVSEPFALNIGGE